MTALFFDKRYDLARVGRYKFNYKLGIGARLEGKTAAETVVDPARERSLRKKVSLLTVSLRSESRTRAFSACMSP